MKRGIRLLGSFIIVYAVFYLFAHSIGPAGPESDKPLAILMNWIPVGLVVSGIGIMKFKKWSQYATIIIMFYFTVDNLYNGLMKYNGDVGYFLSDTHVFFIFPLVVIAFLLIPKVKEQFK